jgi:hypothetical protein
MKNRLIEKPHYSFGHDPSSFSLGRPTIADRGPRAWTPPPLSAPLLSAARPTAARLRHARAVADHPLLVSVPRRSDSPSLLLHVAAA